jgi:hypothetical protein
MRGQSILSRTIRNGLLGNNRFVPYARLATWAFIPSRPGSNGGSFGCCRFEFVNFSMEVKIHEI